MIKVTRVDESNKEEVIEHLSQNVITNVFAFYDLQYDPEHTIMHIASENGIIKGYILVYTALEFPNVILEGDMEINLAEKLIDEAPDNGFIIHTSREFLPAIMEKYPEAKQYVENWMLIERNGACFFKSELVRKLRNEEDVLNLVELISTREDRSQRLANRYRDLIKKNPHFGISKNSKLVSYAGSFLQLPQIWMIGGVYTHPDHRNKGHATSTVSAITEEALRYVDSAALFVRKDNYPAIRVYEKIGYNKIGERFWVDVGTGRKP